jgi:hypothetical protein
MPDYPASWHRASRPRSPKRVTPEGAVLKLITAYLRLCRLGEVHRQQVGMARYGEHGEHVVPYGERGASDLRVDLDGDTRCIYIEVKAPSGRVSPHQEVYLERQRARGHFAFVARSVAEVYEQLTAMGFKVPRPGARRAA